MSDLPDAALADATARWQECADLIAGDVARTTELPGTWRVEVREDEDALNADTRRRLRQPRPGGPAFSSRLTITFGPRAVRLRVPLEVPEIWLVAPDITEMLLSSEVVEIEAGVHHLAERIQDEVIDALWTAWPDCPGHGHPAEVGGLDWVCPTDRHPVVAIGQLGR